MLWFLNNKAITYLIQVLNNPLAFRVPKEAKEACQRKALDCFPKKAEVVCAFSLRIKNHACASHKIKGEALAW